MGKLTNVGISRFNSNYFCTVSRVEEVDWDTLEVEFCVVGDMSLGELQDPRHSTIRWNGHRTVLPGVLTFEAHDRNSRISGVLTYYGVPTQGQVCFTFGSFGYSGLPIELSA